MKIKYKLYGLSAIIACVVLINVAVFWNLEGRIVGLTESDTRAQRRVSAVSALEDAILRMRLAAMEAIVDADARSVAEEVSHELAVNADRASQTLKELEAGDNTRDEAAAVQEIRRRLDIVIPAANTELAALIQSGPTAQELAAIDDKIDSNGNAMNESLALLHDKAAASSAQAKSDIQTKLHDGLGESIALLGISMALVVIALLLLARSLVRSLNQLTTAADALASGVLETQVPARDSRDEVGDLARSLQVFKENLQQMERLKSEQKAAEIKAAEDKRREMEELANGFENSVGQIVTLVSAAATELNASAENLSAISDETSRQATTVAAATEEASVSVQTVASSAEELTASIGEINRQVAEALRVTQVAVEDARKTDATVASLSDAASQISEVVALIQEIAEQTNLLALNATIEAARAGEAGKGFAVVASEVKNLASQTAKATEDIARQVGTVQSVSNDAVSAIRQIGGTIEDVSKISSQIAAAVDQQAAATKEIAHSVQQAAAGTAEVSSTISSVTQAADESRGASGQVLDAARELSSQSETLRREVADFVNRIKRG